MKHSNYLDQPFQDQKKMVKIAKKILKGKQYDALVGTGISGALVVPLLAYVLNKRFCLVRKPGVVNHGSTDTEGNLQVGDRWLFVDDFVSSGDTWERVYKAMGACASDAYKYCGDYLYHTPTFTEKRIKR